MSVNFNESFKALVREVFQEKSEGVINILDEVISNKASEDTRHINNLKELAIKDIKSEIATNDFVRAEIAELKTELKQDNAKIRNEMSELKAELKQDISDLKAELKQDISDLRAELKQDIATLNETLNTEVSRLDNKISELRSEVKQDIAKVRNEMSELKAELKDEISKSKVDIIKWFIGLQLACFGVLAGLLKIMF